MFYKEAVDYIKNIERLGSDYGIERMRELLVLLGEPDKNLKFVHVAGTNGKGSVCAYLTQILMQAGHKVGTYNSPSVFCYNERFCINGKPISDDMVAKYMSIIRQAIENEQKMRDAFQLEKFAPTAFEIETALMFSCFFEEECDICVIETGLGGRWDATNVIEDKELAVITSIGLDHCAILGDTLSKIAAEKAAITKKTVVTCLQNDEIMQQISHPYNIENGEKKFYKVDVVVAKEPTPISADLSGQKFLYDGKEYKIKLLGDHQLTNASIAIAAAKQLDLRWNVTDKNIMQGLQNTAWSARFEVVNDAKERFNISIPHDKTLVLDGGHNPQGALILSDSIKKYFAKKKVALVLGILADKDFEGMVKVLAPNANSVTVVTPPSPRALDANKLKECVDKYCGKVSVCGDIKVAVQNALQGEDDVTVLCGSLTLFSALLEDK